MDDIKRKKKKELGTTNNKNIQSGYRNGIWHRKMCYAGHEKWKKRNYWRNRIAKSGENLNARRKGKLQVFGNIGYERKDNKRVPQTNRKAFRDQVLRQKFHKRDKHLGGSSCKILGTQLKMDKRGSQRNRSKDKKVDDNAQGFTPERWQTICFKNRKRFR